MKNYEIDLRKAAFIFTKELLNLKRDERFLIYVDQGSDYHTAKVIRERAEDIGSVTEVFELSPTSTLPDMAADLKKKIEDGAFDVICELSERYFYPTLVWKRALRSGYRIYSLAGVDADAFIRCIGKVDHNLMFRFGMTLKGILKKAKNIQILSRKGTILQFQMNANLLFQFISRLKGRKVSYIMHPSGMPIQKGQSTFMGGQLAFQGIPETIEGTAVIDGYLWPPREIGYIDEPIILRIKKGSITEIDGHTAKPKILSHWFKGKPKEIQHFCIGFNPGARLTGKIMEAERVFGCISIGIGEYPLHTDGIIRNPSIILNDEIIEQDGSFIHGELSTLERYIIQNYISE